MKGFTLMKIIVFMMIISTLMISIFLFSYLIKSCNKIGNEGLKTYLEEFWEGPERR